MALNGVRHTPVKTRTNRGVIAAKLSNYTLLAFLHDEKSSAQPNSDNNRGDGTNSKFTDIEIRTCWLAACRRLCATSALFRRPEKARELFIEVAPQLV
jgi:hypothetical protein